MRSGARNAALALMFGIAAAGGWVANSVLSPSDAADPQPAGAGSKGVCANGEAPLYWKAPMDPNYVRSEP